MRVAEYYQKHFPRYDKHDNAIIKFKNKDQYFSTDFNSRTNLRMWLKGSEEVDAKAYCKKIILERKKKKKNNKNNANNTNNKNNPSNTNNTTNRVFLLFWSPGAKKNYCFLHC